ncbi:MAG TPA: hypothetical protein VLH35_00880 [Candidatus Acidoferrales bacterium]|nr:hypothetical protein [Candidatus Acidoferrales bacterium]
MMFENNYRTLSTCLAIAGVCLSVLSYFVLTSTPLTALGLSAVMVGAVAFAVSRGQPKISAEASAILLQSGVENISALVEEIGLKSKAIYLPSSMSGGKPKALIPMDKNFSFDKKILPNRLIVRYGAKPEAMGLLLVTPGSAIGGLVEAKVDCSAGDLESSISSVLLGTVNLADGVRATMDGDKIVVEVVNPRLEEGKMWIYDSIGSPIASMVASIAAQVLDKPVSIAGEQQSRGKCIVELKVVGSSL